jgi:dihydrofolate synthase/folylpolyglutamate synthase
VTTEWTYGDALRELWERSSYERGYISNPFGDPQSGERGLARTRRLLELLGDPHQALVIAHVAGSKGKGSTASMIAAISQAAGYRVGLYTSPHLHSFRERIAVDGEPVDERAFAGAADRVAEASAKLEADTPDLGRVTTFELLTAMALDIFAGAGCELVVLEVGLGGTYDATNVVTPAVSAITALDLEHTAVLGATLAEIARAKAGIIKPGVPVVVAPQPPSIITLLTEIAVARRSVMLTAGTDWTFDGTWRDFSVGGPWGRFAGLQSALPGNHQVENAATAIAATWALSPSGLLFAEQAVREGLARVRLAGRFERQTLATGQTVILDGAHTPASARVLADAIQGEYPGQQAVVILGASADKDLVAVGRALQPIARRVIATRSSNPRAADAAQVAAALTALGVAVETAPDVAGAVARATSPAAGDELVLITGSLFVVADAREALGLGRSDPFGPS